MLFHWHRRIVGYVDIVLVAALGDKEAQNCKTLIQLYVLILLSTFRTNAKTILYYDL